MKPEVIAFLILAITKRSTTPRVQISSSRHWLISASAVSRANKRPLLSHFAKLLDDQRLDADSRQGWI